MKYEWTSTRDQLLRDAYASKKTGRIRRVAHALGWPVWVVKRRANALELCHKPQRPWTIADQRFLLDHAGRWPLARLARRLHRSQNAVHLKLCRLQIAQRFRDGYTLSDVALGFGVDDHVVARWVRQGWLRGRRRQSNRRQTPDPSPAPADAWYFTDEDLLHFVRTHPVDFRIEKVEQCWFLGIVLNPNSDSATEHAA